MSLLRIVIAMCSLKYVRMRNKVGDSLIVFGTKMQVLKARMSSLVDQKEENIVTNDLTRSLLAAGTGIGVHKAESILFINNRGFSIKTFMNHKEGKITMHELKAHLKNWSTQRWRLRENMHHLYKFISTITYYRVPMSGSSASLYNMFQSYCVQS